MSQQAGSRVFRRNGDNFMTLPNTASNKKEKLVVVPIDDYIEIAKANRAETLASIHGTSARVTSFTSKPKMFTDRPAKWVYMTPEEGVRLLQERARRPKSISRRLSLVELFDSSVSLDFSADIDGFEEYSDRAIDNYLIAHCSNKGRLREFSRNSEFSWGTWLNNGYARQPYFKGVERKWRHLKASNLKHIAGKLDSDAWEKPFIWMEQLQKEMARCINL